jgi:cytochrome c
MIDFEKLFPAFLVAALVAMLAGFVGKKIVHPHDLKEDAVSIDGEAVADSVGGAAAAPEPILALLASADIARGEKLSKACAACHSFDQGGVNKVGPNLWGVVNAAKGAHAGFGYSAALTEFGGKWDYDALNHFLWKPKAYIADTKMNYAGLKKPEDRAAIIAWLNTLGSNAPMPSAEAIAAEEAALAPKEEAVVVDGDAPVDATGSEVEAEGAAPVEDKVGAEAEVKTEEAAPETAPEVEAAP